MRPTQQQINRDLAERFRQGRQSKYECAETGPQCDPCLGHCGRGCAAKGYLWSPSTSREDCAEVLARITDKDTQIKVINHLGTITDGGKWLGPMVSTWLMLTATPAQISEAIWRATCQ